ncbi:methionyl-tRNA formyltransferase [Candidatus Omnitrophota bacterium]
MSQLNILLIAEESAGLELLKWFSESRKQCHIVAVMAAPNKSPLPWNLSVWSLAEQLKFNRWPIQHVKESVFAKKIQKFDIDLIICVRCSYILGEDILKIPKIGSFNLHNGLLPYYAGLNVGSWAIYHGEKEAGVTLHYMTPEIDSGNIVYQAEFPIDENDTGLSVLQKCMTFGTPLIKKLIQTVSNDSSTIPSVPQDLNKGRYFDGSVPQKGRLIWAKTAEEIVNFVRACNYHPFDSPWGYPKTKYNNRNIQIAEAIKTGISCDKMPGSVGKVTKDGALIASGDEWVLVKTVISEYKRSSSLDILQVNSHLS